MVITILSYFAAGLMFLFVILAVYAATIEFRINRARERFYFLAIHGRIPVGKLKVYAEMFRNNPSRAVKEINQLYRQHYDKT
jgi:hypothetical protein